MWPLPEPTRPAEATRWDPPVLVRLELDHGLDESSRAGDRGARGAGRGTARRVAGAP